MWSPWSWQEGGRLTPLLKVRLRSAVSRTVDVRARAGLDAVAGLLEAGLDELADCEDKQNDDCCDGRNEKAVLNGGRTLVAAGGGNRADVTEHVVPLRGPVILWIPE